MRLMQPRSTAHVYTRDVTDSESEFDGIRYFFQNPKSVGYLKSDHVGFKIFDSVQLYSVVFCFLYFFENNHNGVDYSLLIYL